MDLQRQFESQDQAPATAGDAFLVEIAGDLPEFAALHVLRIDRPWAAPGQDQAKLSRKLSGE